MYVTSKKGRPDLDSELSSGRSYTIGRDPLRNFRDCLEHQRQVSHARLVPTQNKWVLCYPIQNGGVMAANDERNKRRDAPDLVFKI